MTKIIFKHISEVGRNSAYIMSKIQNVLLDAMSVSLEKTIVTLMKKTFSLLADETTNVSTKEQLNLSKIRDG